MRGEYDRVEINLLQIGGRRLRQVRARIGARAPGVVDAAGIGRKITAAMDRENLQIRVALPHALENKMVKRQRRLERIADHVVEIIAAEALAFGKSVGMDYDERLKLFRLRPK